MRLFDQKDIAIVVNAIRDIAPKDKRQRAELIVFAALHLDVAPARLAAAAMMVDCELNTTVNLTRDELFEQPPEAESNVIVLPVIKREHNQP